MISYQSIPLPLWNFDRRSLSNGSKEASPEPNIMLYINTFLIQIIKAPLVNWYFQYQRRPGELRIKIHKMGSGLPTTIRQSSRRRVTYEISTTMPVCSGEKRSLNLLYSFT